MALHVGIAPCWGQLSYYENAEKITINSPINTVSKNEIDKVNLMFKEIKSKINKEVVCIGICLFRDYGNEIRKKFIKCGLNSGFKNVKIISGEIAHYLNALSQTNYKPLKGNVIWVQWGDSFTVWHINDLKSKYIGVWKADYSKMSDLEKIVNESKLNKMPDVLLYNDEIHKEMFSKILAECHLFSYTVEYWASCGSLIKARITSDNHDLTHLDAENFLTQSISLMIGDKEIMCFERPQKLPITYSKKLTKKSNDDVLEIIPSDSYAEKLTLPDYKEINLTFKIDQNAIYSIKLKKHQNGNDSKPESKSDATNLLSFFSRKLMSPSHSEALNSTGSYLIPKKNILLTKKVEAIGIDLGTSRCCVAVNRNGAITTVALDNTGERLLPSYVSYDEENVKCGRIVVSRLRHYSKSTILDSKRIIGRNFNDIEIDENWDFTVNCDTENKVFLEVSSFSGKRKITAEEVAADLLKYMKQKTEEFQAKNITKVVISVPSTFTDFQKSATIEAAKSAGFGEIVLLPEPVAAAFAYFIDRQITNNTTALLFDLGGGTLDVCAFKIKNNFIKILSNTGDSKLGGRNFDTVLINYFRNVLNARYEISDLGDKKYRLMLESQRIKEDLTSIFDSSIDVEDFDNHKEGFISINREEFQSLAKTLLNKIKTTIQAALFISGLKTNQIDKILLVGGGSRMPMIKQLLRDTFPDSEHCCEEHPDEVVAIGAAYYAYNIFSK